MIFLYFYFHFQRISCFNWRRQHFRKIVLVEEELNGIDINDIVSLEDLLRLVLINEECGNPKVADCGEPTRNITLWQRLYSISPISIWNIANKLGKYDFISCRWVISNFKARQLFSDQMNRNLFDLVLAAVYRNCSTIVNLRSLKLELKEFNKTLRSSNKASFK